MNGKSQWVRLFDVLVLGPYMIWLSQRLRGNHATLLFLAGAGTIAYNWANYVEISKRGQ